MNDRHHAIVDRDNRGELHLMIVLAVKAAQGSRGGRGRRRRRCTRRKRRGEVDDGAEAVQHGEAGFDSRRPVCADPLQEGEQQYGSTFGDHIDEGETSL